MLTLEVPFADMPPAQLIGGERSPRADWLATARFASHCRGQPRVASPAECLRTSRASL